MAIDVEIYDMRLLKKNSERTDMVFTARMDVRNYSPRSDLKRAIRDAAILEYQSMISRTNP